MSSQPDSASTETMLDMANLLLQLGNKDKDFALLEGVVKNNHENADVIRMVKTAFENAGFGNEGGELIKKTSQEVIDINNQGVILANEGKFEEGISLIRKALQAMPNNDLMLTNLCGMMIGLMNRVGRDDRLISEARELLERAGKINPTNKKYNPYMNILNRLGAAPAEGRAR